VTAGTAGIVLRKATAEDAAAGVDVLRRSITELCGADHGGDPARLARWLGNKTAAEWAGWLDRADATLMVAEVAGRIAAVGMVDREGCILLLYVAPEARFRGVSRTLLSGLEAVARAGGATSCRLQTTRTARRFYLSRGYAPMASDPDWLSRPLPDP
jgi:GNAT superfamily N-acetyltransferase